jgi:hypothetical protein
MKDKFFVVLCAGVLASLLSTSSIAEPLLTISCDKPEGSSITYGVSLTERLNAAAKEQPEPTNPTLRGPIKNGYLAKPTFVVDSNRKKITTVWNEVEEDAKLREQAKKLGLLLPLPTVSDGVIVQFLPEQISAIQVTPWSITTFSFFPKMGKAFINQQSMDLGFHNAMQLSTFARCEFSWSGPR